MGRERRRAAITHAHPGRVQVWAPVIGDPTDAEGTLAAAPEGPIEVTP